MNLRPTVSQRFPKLGTTPQTDALGLVGPVPNLGTIERQNDWEDRERGASAPLPVPHSDPIGNRPSGTALACCFAGSGSEERERSVSAADVPELAER